MMENNSGGKIHVQGNGVAKLGDVDEKIADTLLPVVHAFAFIANDKGRWLAEWVFNNRLSLIQNFNSTNVTTFFPHEFDGFGKRYKMKYGSTARSRSGSSTRITPSPHDDRNGTKCVGCPDQKAKIRFFGNIVENQITLVFRAYLGKLNFRGQGTVRGGKSNLVSLVVISYQ